MFFYMLFVQRGKIIIRTNKSVVILYRYHASGDFGTLDIVDVTMLEQTPAPLHSAKDAAAHDEDDEDIQVTEESTKKQNKKRRAN